METLRGVMVKSKQRAVFVCRGVGGGGVILYRQLCAQVLRFAVPLPSQASLARSVLANSSLF